MLTTKKRPQINKINRETALKAQKMAEQPFERFYNWIPAGSGYFETPEKDGKYRHNCNQIYYLLECEHDKEHERKYVYSHCNKLDCKACFVAGCSFRARSINHRLTHFQELSYKNGIKIGKILHVSVIINAEMAHFTDSRAYATFKRSTLYPMLKEIGLVGGAIFLHVWSNRCEKCGKKEEYCKCESTRITKKVNIHVHIVGFGYLIDTKKFRELYPNYIYRNHLPRRDNAYFTIFYALTKVALWKNGNKKQTSYNYFGYLHPTKFSQESKHQIFLTDNCSTCETPRVIKYIKDKELKKKEIYRSKITVRNYKIKDLNGLKMAVNNVFYRSKIVDNPEIPISKKEIINV